MPTFILALYQQLVNRITTLGTLKRGPHYGDPPSLILFDLITKHLSVIVIDQLCIILDRLLAIFYLCHDLDIICLILVQLTLSILGQCHTLSIFA